MSVVIADRIQRIATVGDMLSRWTDVMRIIHVLAWRKRQDADTGEIVDALKGNEGKDRTSIYAKQETG